MRLNTEGRGCRILGRCQNRMNGLMLLLGIDVSTAGSVRSSIKQGIQQSTLLLSGTKVGFGGHSMEKCVLDTDDTLMPKSRFLALLLVSSADIS